MTLQQVYEAILGQLGVLVLLLFIIYAGFKRWWVFGWYSKYLEDQNKRLEERLDRAIGQSEHATGLADQLRVAATKQIESSRD